MTTEHRVVLALPPRGGRLMRRRPYDCDTTTEHRLVLALPPRGGRLMRRPYDCDTTPVYRLVLALPPAGGRLMRRPYDCDTTTEHRLVLALPPRGGRLMRRPYEWRRAEHHKRHNHKKHNHKRRHKKSRPRGCEIGRARLGGFEPPTFGTGIRRSILLSYKRMKSKIRPDFAVFNAGRPRAVELYAKAQGRFHDSPCRCTAKPPEVSCGAIPNVKPLP